jgi:hypothetical protein
LLVCRPSPLIRWPLHILSAMFVFVIALIAGVAVLFARLGEPTPWALLIGGGGVCALFIALNTTVAAMRLRIDGGRVALSVGPWSKVVSLDEAIVVVEATPAGVAAVRVVPASGGRPLWVSAAWFRDFDAALAEIERGAIARGGAVTSKSDR